MSPKFLIVSCLFLAVNGFRISFLAVPTVVNRLSPDPQRLSCAVHQTAGEQAHITSIVMIRENSTTGVNDTIALVTAYAAPHASVDANLMTVSGSVKPGQVSGEFLTVEWPVPGDTVIGNYFCEVFGLDHLGHPLNLVEGSSLHAPTLDIQDVIEYIIVLQNNQKQLTDQVSDLLKNCAGCGQNVTTRLADAEDSIAILESAVGSANMAAQHVETGKFRCGPSLKVVTGHFDSPFNGPAQLVVSIDGLETHQASQKVQITNTNDGQDFTLTCDATIYVSGTWVAFQN